MLINPPTAKIKFIKIIVETIVYIYNMSLTNNNITESYNKLLPVFFVVKTSNKTILKTRLKEKNSWKKAFELKSLQQKLAKCGASKALRTNIP